MPRRKLGIRSFNRDAKKMRIAIAEAGIGAGGGTDHGTLSGLGDDDHSQYGALAQNEEVTGAWTFDNTIQLKYDATNYVDFDVASDGALTITTAGTAADIFLTPISGKAQLTGQLGIGVLPAYPLQVRSTSQPQLKLEYDATYDADFTVGSLGELTISALNDFTLETFFDMALVTGGVVQITGDVGIGVAPTVALQIRDTGTPQLLIEYDASNYVGFSVASDGDLTIASTGTGADMVLFPAGHDVQIWYDASNYGYITLGSAGDVYFGAAGTAANMYLVPQNDLYLQPTTQKIKVTGSLGIGFMPSGAAALQIRNTTDPQVLIEYDATYKADLYVNSAGNLYIDTVGGSINHNLNSLYSGYDLILRNTLTDLTAKGGRFLVSHYNNAEEEMTAFVGISSAADNTVYFGGGSTIHNAATAIHFRIGATATTLNGTTRLQLDDGHVYAYDPLYVITTATQFYLKYDASNYIQAQVASDGGTTLTSYGTDADLTLAPASDLFLIPTGGNTEITGEVGIGVTPTYPLHIRSTTTNQIRVEYDPTHALSVNVTNAGNTRFYTTGGDRFYFMGASTVRLGVGVDPQWVLDLLMGGNRARFGYDVSNWFDIRPQADGEAILITGGTDADLSLQPAADLLLTPTSGLTIVTGDIQYTGDLIADRAANHTGYIYVPLQDYEVLETTTATSSNTTTGTALTTPSTGNIPAEATAIAVRVYVKTDGTANDYVFYGPSNTSANNRNHISAYSQVVGLWNTVNGILAINSSTQRRVYRFQVVTSGTLTFGCYIVGYFV